MKEDARGFDHRSTYKSGSSADRSIRFTQRAEFRGAKMNSTPRGNRRGGRRGWKKKTRSARQARVWRTRALDNLWCRTWSLAQRWAEGSGSRARERVGEFVGHYIGDGCLITFPLISARPRGRKKKEAKGNRIGERPSAAIIPNRRDNRGPDKSSIRGRAFGRDARKRDRRVSHGRPASAIYLFIYNCRTERPTSKFGIKTPGKTDLEWNFPAAAGNRLQAQVRQAIVDSVSFPPQNQTGIIMHIIKVDNNRKVPGTAICWMHFLLCGVRLIRSYGNIEVSRTAHLLKWSIILTSMM